MSPWKHCLELLEGELSPQQFNTWIRPLHAVENENDICLLAPNRFVLDWINERYLSKIEGFINDHHYNKNIKIQVGSNHQPILEEPKQPTNTFSKEVHTQVAIKQSSHINKNFNFDNFVEGKSNQFARATAIQVANSPGGAYNPLFIYGGVGLGKTHLMHAIGSSILEQKPTANITYLNSERFVRDMVKAIQYNTIDTFKRYYRSLDVLLIDDIQFFAGKDRSQEEFFHTFNSLLEDKHQIVMTCDRYPKEVEGLEQRLKSRFGWGLTTAISPPDLETRVAIIDKKALDKGNPLPHEVSFFIAKRFQSNVRELEGAINLVIANANLTGKPITLDFAKTALHDLLIVQNRQISIDNIQKITAEYYKIRVSDLLSKRRSRSVTRPRQIAMTIAKELTNHSLPEIGEAFGGRDHTTVLHSCRKIKSLRESEAQIEEDYTNLINTLTS